MTNNNSSATIERQKMRDEEIDNFLTLTPEEQEQRLQQIRDEAHYIYGNIWEQIVDAYDDITKLNSLCLLACELAAYGVDVNGLDETTNNLVEEFQFIYDNKSVNSLITDMRYSNIALPPN